jgi:hypothetical protein
MGVSELKQKNSAMAAYMKAHPAQYPDSVRQPGRGQGAADRVAARNLVPGAVSNARWMAGMLGGVLAFRAGLTKINPLAEDRYIRDGSRR